jgi:hypothetical protein
MAIQVNGVTAINNSKVLQNIGRADNCRYDAFHPAGIVDLGTSTVITNADPVLSRTLTADTTFTHSQVTNSYNCQILLHLDLSTDGWTPTFPSNYNFPATPAWSAHRYWAITILERNNGFLCTAQGFDEGPYSGSGLGGSGAFLTSTWTTPNQWRTGDIYYSGSGFPETYCYVSFQHDAANQRVNVTYAHGNSSQPTQFQPVVYVTYGGLSNISTVRVQYNVQSQSCTGDCNAANYGFGPTPVQDNKLSGSYYTLSGSGTQTFGWMAQANPNTFQNNDTTTSANFGSINPDLRIEIVDSVEGTFTSTSEIPGVQGINLRAYIGTVPIK